MKAARIYLYVTFVILAPFGVALLFAPDLLTLMAGLGLDAPSARTDVRATYGGLFTALGCWALLGARREALLRPVLLFLLLALAMLATGRILGLVIDGGVDMSTTLGRYNLVTVAAYELPATLVTWWMLRRVDSAPTSA